MFDVVGLYDAKDDRHSSRRQDALVCVGYEYGASVGIDGASGCVFDCALE